MVQLIDYSLVPTYIAALMAKRLQRPVKWQFDRKEAFMFGSLDAMETDFTVGFKKDGTITAVKMKSLFENLSYEPGLHLLENTKIPNVESETNVAQVNKGPTHAIRCEQLPAFICHDPRVQSCGRGTGHGPHRVGHHQ